MCVGEFYHLCADGVCVCWLQDRYKACFQDGSRVSTQSLIMCVCVHGRAQHDGKQKFVEAIPDLEDAWNVLPDGTA